MTLASGSWSLDPHALQNVDPAFPILLNWNGTAIGLFIGETQGSGVVFLV